jgi:hypothetical protein
MQLTMEMTEKLDEWFGPGYTHKVVKRDEENTLVWVDSKGFDEGTREYTLVRLFQVGGNMELSVDFTANQLDFDTVGSIMIKLRQLFRFQ